MTPSDTEILDWLERNLIHLSGWALHGMVSPCPGSLSTRPVVREAGRAMSGSGARILEPGCGMR